MRSSFVFSSSFLFFTLACILPKLLIAQNGTSVCFDSKKLCFSASTNDSSDFVTITMTTTLLPRGWVSVGLGKNMANANVWVIQSTSQGSNVQVTDRFSKGYTVPTEYSDTQIQLLSSPKIQSNEYTVQLTRPKSAHQFTFLNQPQEFIWAFSETSSGSSLPIHTRKGTFSYNAFTSQGTVDSTFLDSSTALTIHKYSMGVAWHLLAAPAIFTARFLKPQLPKSWFKIHVTLFTLVLLLSTVGFTVVMIGLKSETRFQSVHGLLGLIIFITLYLQFILGVVIDRMFNPKRSKVPLRDRAHWILGFLLFVSAAVNIFIGMVITSVDFIWISLSAVYYALFFLLFIWAQVKLGQHHELNME
ncbi:hypothetical protein HMI54_012986 [Coelomomyces lativittatus]|nr:hypothetical protein HMI56_003630 [Coelomomyces lativittatus]KAJ1510382.1 hypothetical protein HMI55_007015 [Coelomomyces lativittatus]KAJ1515042.1 hypothetical protein HMI54_012986 [Coelomomyces lativittatus]